MNWKTSGNVIIVKRTKHIKAVDNTLQLFRYRVECDTDVDNIWQSSAHMFNILPFFPCHWSQVFCDVNDSPLHILHWEYTQPTTSEQRAMANNEIGS